MLKGNLLFGQSGGPTAVFNSSAAGVFIEALDNNAVDKVYAAANGIAGLLNENIYDINQEEHCELLHLKNTPSSMIGSCRHKLKDYLLDDSEYQEILRIFKKYNIRFFLYNGGNDSMDTCNKISRYLESVDYECKVIGIPKTIDNDLCATDHCPGYASAAKYVATTTMEICADACVYDTPMVCIIEIMGRHAGWLAASSALASIQGFGPDLIYLPEVVFDINNFLNDVKEIYNRKNKVIIAISEGLRTKENLYIPELVKNISKDSFGHKQLGGAAQVLADFVANELHCKVRGIELSLMQRAASHLASKIDVEEAYGAGAYAVKMATSGKSKGMVSIKRLEGGEYKSSFELVPLSITANTEKKFPIEWINDKQNNVLPDFFEYILPLIQEKSEPQFENGLPRYAKLKKVQVRK